MFSAYISTRAGAETEIVVTDADPQYIADVVELLKADAERKRVAIDALAQHHLFDGVEDR
jgi:23S rRNA U2552 (ribose-2'-O)-methylase RlmE/FtsJ